MLKYLINCHFVYLHYNLVAACCISPVQSGFQLNLATELIQISAQWNLKDCLPNLPLKTRTRKAKNGIKVFLSRQF
jgi:hypothetical protein